jgi:TatD DNase family protein
MLVDTHCHIHDSEYEDAEGALARAREAGVAKLVCVGTDAKTSAEAVAFAMQHENVWASVGLHPHDARSGQAAVDDLYNLLVASKSFHTGPVPQGSPPNYSRLKTFGNSGYPPSGSPVVQDGGRDKIIAIGECGLDYFYNNSPKEQQIEMLHAQFALAQEFKLPMIFHVREAFDDFWPIFDQYPHVRGVLHSFTDTQAQVDQALKRDLFIGINGISTFTKVEAQQKMYKTLPLEKIVLETDAPFLTPVPKRGTINEPAFVTLVATFLANLRSISLEELSRATSQNASQLFSIKTHI